MGGIRIMAIFVPERMEALLVSDCATYLISFISTQFIYIGSHSFVSVIVIRSALPSPTRPA